MTAAAHADTRPALTYAQERVLDMIKEHIRVVGYPPTRAEISQHFGWSSGTSAECHLNALARKGLVEVRKGIPRGIRVL